MKAAFFTAAVTLAWGSVAVVILTGGSPVLALESQEAKPPLTVYRDARGVLQFRGAGVLLPQGVEQAKAKERQERKVTPVAQEVVVTAPEGQEASRGGISNATIDEVLGPEPLETREEQRGAPGGRAGSLGKEVEASRASKPWTAGDYLIVGAFAGCVLSMAWFLFWLQTFISVPACIGGLCWFLLVYFLFF